MESLQLRQEELVHQTVWAAPWTVLEPPGSYEELSTHSPPGQVPCGLHATGPDLHILSMSDNGHGRG